MIETRSRQQSRIRPAMTGRSITGARWITLIRLLLGSIPCILWGAVLHGAASAPWTAPAAAAARTNSVPADRSSIAEGKKLFGQECVSCHGAAGKGDGPKASALKSVPSDLSDARMWQEMDGALAWKITQGKTPMPAFGSKFSAHQVWALVNFIRTMAPRGAGRPSPATHPQTNQIAKAQNENQRVGNQAGAEASGRDSGSKRRAWIAPRQFVRKRNSVPATESSIAMGKELYQQECLSCHGGGGKGDGHTAGTLDVTPADLSDPRMSQETDGALFWKINRGNPPMPSFQLRFSTREVWELVNYVRTFPRRDALATSGKSNSQGNRTGPDWPDGRGHAKLPGEGTNSAHGSGQPQPTNEASSKASSTGNPKQNLDTTLLRPQYVHVLLNPMPIYGLGLSVVALSLALILRSRPMKRLALGLVILSAVSAWPTYWAGEKAYHRTYAVADNDGQEWLDAHKHRAEELIYVFYVLAAVALGAALVPAKTPKTAFALALLTLMMTLASLAAGGWIARAGGKIRHPEFRKEPTSSKPPPANS